MEYHSQTEAFANYIASTSTLVVYNTLNNLDLIEQIIDVLRKDGPRQVRIMTKFIEVSQDNTDELGFDWIINPIGFQRKRWHEPRNYIRGHEWQWCCRVL